MNTIATYIPAFPIYPPETSWMRSCSSDLPAIVARQLKFGGRLVYLAADIDRCFGRRGLPDHGDLLASIISWTVKDKFPLNVAGPGYIDCHLYLQNDRLIAFGKLKWDVMYLDTLKNTFRLDRSKFRLLKSQPIRIRA